MPSHQRDSYDAVIVGAGPNGLAAAITLAQAGWSVLLIEGRDTVGGGLRSAELTLPGFLHDICSAIHPLAVASPLFRSLPLADHGLRWVHPAIPVAHPLDGGRAVPINRSVADTAAHLGRDGAAYRRLMGPFVANYQKLLHDFLGPLRIPRYPFMMMRFGPPALMPATTLARLLFRGEEARAAFGGLSAHSIMALEKPATSAFGIMLGMLAHAVGWPLPVGGAQRIADALASYLRTLDGEITTGRWVESVDELPPARALLLDVTPRQLVDLAGHRLPDGYRRRLANYRHGPGVYKVDFALDGPIPWSDETCTRAGTVHVGGTLEEIATSEGDAFHGRESAHPFVLVAQQSLFDPSRAPDGHHTVWAYCHVPNGSTVDMSDRIEAQIERFAPGFRARIIARNCHSPAAMQRYNPNYVGGDINGGVQDLTQLFTRPVLRPSPYTTPDPAIFLCSSSTPPGGGVHGMCGYFAAQAALRRHTVR
jgi:phytoene dehydrogenase-like protein